MRGRFITFEGGEGAGKSTQAKLIGERLRMGGQRVTLTHEPQGEIRPLLVEGEPGRWSAEAEALLNYAQRDQHLRGIVRPALERGEIVICDRFMDSTRAYQGYAGGCDLKFIDTLESAIVGASRPDLTIVFDLDPAIGLARAGARGGADRFERKGRAFHATLREGFYAIAAGDPKRCKIVNADADIDAVTAAIWQLVEPLQP
jgi:dTMP kinase